MLSENPISQICRAVFIFKEDKWGRVKQKKSKKKTKNKQTQKQKQNIERLKLIKSFQQLYWVITAILM